VGAAVKLNQQKREGYTDFTLDGRAPERASWSFERAKFDDLLLKHAAENGVSVHEGVRVTEIKFCPENPKKPIAALWKKNDTETGEIKFDFMVDASGRNGIMSTRYLKNRKFTQGLKNVAFWGYWKNTGMYMPGTPRENAVWIEALTDETGWTWFIPLQNGITSVGVVLAETSSRAKKAKAADNKEHYLSQVNISPGLVKLLENAEMVGEVKSAGDYSYTSVNNQYAGPNYRIVGDAGGERSEIFVLGVYQQIHAQKNAVLSDVDEDNFDRAFDFIRPVIQGDNDTHSKVDMQKVIDLLGETPGIIGVDPMAHERVSKKMEAGLMADNGPLMMGDAFSRAVGEDEEAKELLHMMNSRKAITNTIEWAHNYEGDKINGLSVVLKRGELGLARE
ncbi:hypothetical protein R3P38DRAFT_2892475, partial [Favolaschia claudopus]